MVYENLQYKSKKILFLLILRKASYDSSECFSEDNGSQSNTFKKVKEYENNKKNNLSSLSLSIFHYENFGSINTNQFIGNENEES